LDAILARRIDERDARRAMLAALIAIAGLVVAARVTGAPPTDPARLTIPAAVAALLVTTLGLWRAGVIGRSAVGAVLAGLVLLDLWAAARARRARDRKSTRL